MDTDNYVQQNNQRATDEVRSIMTQNSLVDIYRELNGDRRLFTWTVGNPVRKCARLDYFLISESLMSKTTEASIIPGYRSDHSIVTLELKLMDQNRGKGFYKMNTSLLRDKEYVQMIENVIRNTTLTYSLPIYSHNFVHECPSEVEVTISWSLFWETLILNMRTETISFSIHRKRRSMEEETKVITEIQRIENIEEGHMSEEMQSRLSVYREKLIISERKKWMALS